jgi:hypothetical protein
MKIGIFGDSYAIAWDTLSPFWSNIMRDHYGYNIENNAYGGTGLDYSYRLFMQSYESYDKIIFVTSHPNRKTVYGISDTIEEDVWISRPFKEKFKYLKEKFVTGMYTGWETVTKELTGIEVTPSTMISRNELYEDAHSLLNLIYKYPHADFLTYHAMIDSIRYRHDNVMIIPAFDVYEPYGMINISKLDYEHYGSAKENPHKRYNHMSKDQSFKFAEYLNDAIVNDDIQGLLDKLHRDNVSKFFEHTPTLNGSGLL